MNFERGMIKLNLCCYSRCPSTATSDFHSKAVSFMIVPTPQNDEGFWGRVIAIFVRLSKPSNFPKKFHSDLFVLAVTADISPLVIL
jgi:hypothetical protein